MKKSENDLNQVLRYTQCIDLWLSNKGEYDTLTAYDNYVKSMIREKNLDQIKTLSEWLSDTNIDLFNEYDQYVEKLLRGNVYTLTERDLAGDEFWEDALKHDGTGISVLTDTLEQMIEESNLIISSDKEPKDVIKLISYTDI